MKRARTVGLVIFRQLLFCFCDGVVVARFAPDGGMDRLRGEVGQGGKVEAVALVELVDFADEFVSPVRVRGGREHAEVSAGNEVIGNREAVLVEEAAQEVGKMSFFMKRKVACIFAVEVVQVRLGVVVVFVEVEGEGIVRGAVAEEAVRVEGERVCSRAVLGFDLGAEFIGYAFHFRARALPEDKGVGAVGSFKGNVEVGNAELVHDEAVGEFVAVGCGDVMESVKERCSSLCGREALQGYQGSRT